MQCMCESLNHWLWESIWKQDQKKGNEGQTENIRLRAAMSWERDNIVWPAMCDISVISTITIVSVIIANIRIGFKNIFFI